MPERNLLGLSACLAGQKVRYDGGDKANPGLAAWRSAGVEFLHFCPEAQAGLPIPREPMELIAKGSQVRAVGLKTGRDYTGLLAPWCLEWAETLAAMGVVGVVLKSNSPSCAGTHPAEEGIDGLLAAALGVVAPLIPVTHEKEVADPEGRADFASRIFVLKSWRELKSRGIGRSGLIAFQTSHKLELMAHSPAGCNALGRVVADPMTEDCERVDAYEKGLLACLAQKATSGRHVNALSHAAGYLRGRAPEALRAELRGAIENYREGRAPLSEPVLLLASLVAEASIPYLASQTYLNPHPVQLALWNLSLTSART